MTHIQPTPRFSAAAGDYAVAVFREVMRVAAVMRRGFDAGDLAAEISAEVLENPESIMARYPDPVRYARQRVRHAGISYERRQRVQRGEGARLHHGPDGLLQPGRTYVSGNATGHDGAPELFAGARDHRAEFEAAADERMSATLELRRCCQGLTLAEVHEVWLVDACGYSVQEVAALRGQRRETVSRRLNETRRRIRQNRAEMSESEMSSAGSAAVSSTTGEVGG
jgi:DNA-directed RNA polymerase specialized sigma24 family protein